MLESGDKIRKNEEIIDFTNGALTKFLIKLSAEASQKDEQAIGSYFHVLNDLERIGDQAENFYEISEEMFKKKIEFSSIARKELNKMIDAVLQMLDLAKNAFETSNKENLKTLATLEESVDQMKKDLTASHFARLAEGDCKIEVSPYYSSAVSRLERVADHRINVGFSIVNPVGSQKEN